MFNTILFDWDGCMADTLSIWMESYKQLFAKRNIYPSEDQIAGKVFGDWAGPVKVGVKDLEVFTKELLEDVTRGLEKVELHPYVFETIKKLHGAGKKLAVVTTSKRGSVYPSVEKFGLIKYIQTIISAEDVVKHKPDPEIIYKAIAKMESQNEQAIIVGDSEKDVLAGKAAGISTAVFFPEDNKRFYKEEHLRSLNPDFFITDFRKIFSIVQEP